MLDVLKIILPDLPHDGIPSRFLPLRRPARGCDVALTGTSRRWLRRLPPRRRPLRLCIEYPRIANQLAWSWTDPALTAHLLDDLLLDRRGSRRGFGAAVVRELHRLREFNDQQRLESRPEGFWSAVGRVVGSA